MILVTGAHGHQGKLLVPKLAAAGKKVRAMRATPGKEEELLKLGAHEVIVGDMADVDTYTRALKGIESVFHVGPTLSRYEKEMGFAMIEAARRNGVRHVVMSSTHYSIANIIQHRNKRDIEERLLESGLAYTIIKPCDFMMPELYMTPVLETGSFPQFWPSAPDRRGSLIDIGDLTDAVAKVLTEGDKHFYAAYELVGSDKLTIAEIARILSRVMSREIEVVQKTIEDLFHVFFKTTTPTPETQHAFDIITSSCDWYGKYEFVGNPNVLTWLLGRPPTTFEECSRKAWAQICSEQGLS